MYAKIRSCSICGKHNETWAEKWFGKETEAPMDEQSHEKIPLSAGMGEGSRVNRDGLQLYRL
jgi:hypothetical protein